MLVKARDLPDLETMIQDTGLAPDEVAEYLNVSPRTLRHWRKAGAAPRPAMLALFFATRWGLSWVEAEAVNQCMLASQRARFAEQRCAKLLQQVAALEKLTTGAANSGIFRRA